MAATARRALTYLEAAALGLEAGGGEAGEPGEIDVATLERAVDRAAVRYDRDGDQHYDVISAFIKSIRGSDADAALHYLARMIEAGEDPRFIARRLIVHASEDIGYGPDRPAGRRTSRRRTRSSSVGLARGQDQPRPGRHPPVPLAPKSNAVIKAIGAAEADVRRAYRPGRCPHTCGMRTTRAHSGSATGTATGIRTTTRAASPSDYAPTSGRGPLRYHEPSQHGTEARYAEPVRVIRAALGKPGGRRLYEPPPD